MATGAVMAAPVHNELVQHVLYILYVCCIWTFSIPF